MAMRGCVSTLGGDLDDANAFGYDSAGRGTCVFSRINSDTLANG